jgi:HK97 family phage portal protein
MGLGELLRGLTRPDRGDGERVQERVLEVKSWDAGDLPSSLKGMAVGYGAGRYQGAMSVPGAWRASLLISGLLGGLPWHLYRDGADGIARRLPTPPLLEQPSPPDTRVVTLTSMALDLVWHGNAVALVSGRDESGMPRSLLPVPAPYVQAERTLEPLPGVPVGSIGYRIGGGDRLWSPDEVIHVKGPCEPGGMRGMGVLEAHLTGGLALAQELDRHASGIATSHVPSVTIKSLNPDLTAPEAAELKASFMRSQATRQPAVINASTEITPLAWNPTETQLIEARTFSLVTQALIFGLDPSWLGAAQASRPYANIEQEAVNLWRYSSLADHLGRFEGELTRHMPLGEWVRANLDARLRPDTQVRYGTYQVAIDAGFLTVDEVRQLEDRAPLPPQAAPPQEEPDEVGERDEADLWLYWVTGAGLAKWSGADQPLTALYQQLKRHMPRDQAAASALSWFKDALGREPTWRDGEVPDQPGAPRQPARLKKWIKAQGREVDPAALTVLRAQVDLLVDLLRGRHSFNPDQPRDPDGKWGSGPGGGAATAVLDPPRRRRAARQLTNDEMAIDYADTRESWSEDQAGAVDGYAGWLYEPINTALRSAEGMADADDDTRRDIATLDALLDSYRTPGTVVGVRAVGRSLVVPPPGEAVGEVITAPGYQSVSMTTSAKDVTQVSSSDIGRNYRAKPIRLRMIIPPGMPAIVVQGSDNAVASEREILLPHNTRYVVSADEMEGDKRWLTVTALPPA